MPRSASNPSSTRHLLSTRKASTGPMTLSPSSTPSTSISSHEPAQYAFNSSPVIQISRTVSVTVEVSPGSTPASRIDVSQPVTASCYSPTSSRSDEYLDAASEYGTSTLCSSQGSYTFISSAVASGSSLSYYDQSSDSETQSSTEYSYSPLEDLSASSSQSQQQYGLGSTPTFTNISSLRLSILDRFLTVDSREDTLVVEARAAIREGAVRDENTFAPNIYGWEVVIDSL